MNRQFSIQMLSLSSAAVLFLFSQNALAECPTKISGVLVNYSHGLDSELGWRIAMPNGNNFCPCGGKPKKVDTELVDTEFHDCPPGSGGGLMGRSTVTIGAFDNRTNRFDVSVQTESGFAFEWDVSRSLLTGALSDVAPEKIKPGAVFITANPLADAP